MSSVWQEDANEYLLFVLDKLHHELIKGSAARFIISSIIISYSHRGEHHIRYRLLISEIPSHRNVLTSHLLP